ncbi:hypothetical protein OIU34_17315 [Pararhizobium sp. BT-229]|uniref:hypothetical protein n=1 Tax=Pararhizobium sp. BT-229 TaxID=2986923 RepID=UPI0021F78D2A|nr:hypothetical protein [Pararhizobium sp. BT-229]MCV9963662.1 hypothetical protein [Pararhizobium sp. BT-229]
MAKKIRWRLFRITHRTSGLWTMFSIWLCALFTISYGQEAVTRSTGMAYLMMARATATMDAAAFFQFHGEVGLYASHASILLVSLLILAVFKPSYRFAMMVLSVVATSAIATGLLEKLVYLKWTRSNDSLLLGEQVRASAEMAAVGLDTWVFSPDAVLDLGWMLRLDLSIIVLSSLWAIASWKISAGRSAALHRSAG